MLISFKVSNFRSFNEEQTFSLVASGYDTELPDNIITNPVHGNPDITFLPGLKDVKFLKGAAIYGANASGKSNLIQAIEFVIQFIQHSGTKSSIGDDTRVDSFKLSAETREKPSNFEMAFVANGERFTYRLSLDAKRVHEESLTAYPKGLPRLWFKRRLEINGETYAWDKPSTLFKRDRQTEEKTRNNASYISVAAQFNHPQISPIFSWFRERIRFINLVDGFKDGEAFTTGLMQSDVDHRNSILNLLRRADLGVLDAKIDEKEIPIVDLERYMPPSVLEKLISKTDGTLRPIKSTEVHLTHKGMNGEHVIMDFEDEESAGTRKFFSLLGPWLVTLKEGYTVFVDEVESSLHPILVLELLKLVFSSESNNTGPQIVFTTHNTLFMDPTLIRRDQIWFTEKNRDGATCIYPLTDYSPRKGEALAKGYLAGRYGAIPFLPDGLSP